MVDHSDRCYHFISVMEMIELMRHEQVRYLYLSVCKHARVFNAQLEYLKNNECSNFVWLVEIKNREMFVWGYVIH